MQVPDDVGSTQQVPARKSLNKGLASMETAVNYNVASNENKALKTFDGRPPGDNAIVLSKYSIGRAVLVAAQTPCRAESVQNCQYWPQSGSHL